MISTFHIVILVLFGLTLPVYCYAEKFWGFKIATILKLTLSAMFVSVAIYGLVTRGPSMANFFILIATLFCFIGDFFLQYIDRDGKKFNYGIYAFLISQIFIIGYITVMYGYSWWALLVWVAFVGLALTVKIIKKIDLGINNIPLTAYTAIIAFMAANAVIILFVGNTHTILLGIGGILFFVSDLLLGLWKYIDKKWHWAWLNWISYFCGVMLIALSTAFI